MIELRPSVSGDYKGLIFSDSINESNQILEEQRNFKKILIRI